MFTYIIYKKVIYEYAIKDLLEDGDSLDKAIGIWMLLILGIFGIDVVIIDLIFIPIYLLIGITALIIKLIER